MKFDQDLWYELNPRVRCAFGNVFNLYGVGLVKKALLLQLLSEVLVSTICCVEKLFFVHDQITKNYIEDRYGLSFHALHGLYTRSLRETLLKCVIDWNTIIINYYIFIIYN